MPTIDPAQVYDPSLYGEQQIIAQRQALANLLKQNGLSEMPATSSVGGIAGRTSPLQGVAKLVQLLSGQNLQDQVNSQQQAYGARQAQALQGMFQGQTDGLPPAQAALAAGAAQGAPGPTNGAAQAMGAMPPPQQRPGAMQMPGASSQQSLAAYLLNPEAYGKDLAGAISPNETTRTALQGNMDPVAANRAAFEKATTDGTIFKLRKAGLSDDQIKAVVLGEAAKAAEFDRKPGNFYSNGVTGESGIVPFIPHNANIIGRPAANGAVAGVQQIPGAPSVISSTSAAQTAGTNSQTPTTAYDAAGTPVYSTKGLDVGRAGRVPGDTDASIREQIRQVQTNGGQPINPADQPAIDREVAKLTSRLSPEQRPGVVSGANDAQKQLGDRFTTLRDNVAQAQTTNSYLDNIKQLSTAAATGKFSDRLDYANALLSLAGSEKATDAKTANDLLNKYTNQIVSRLSTGGLGTDAARTILGSAYPNAHMTQGAIAEAVDNIKSVNEMGVAKLKMLSSLGNARDAAAYQQVEQKFDQTADPRIFQLMHMPAAQAQQFLSKMPADVQADLRKRAQALKQMGAL